MISEHILFHPQEIEGLKGLNNLKKLYLYSNQIQVLDNLQHLQQLEILWLNDNNISHIQVRRNCSILY